MTRGRPRPPPFAIGDALGYGWNTFWKNLGPMALIARCVRPDRVRVRRDHRVGSVFPQIVVQLVGFLVSMLITLGWMRVTLEITDGVKPEFGDVFRAQGYGPFIGATILFYIGS